MLTQAFSGVGLSGARSLFRDIHRSPYVGPQAFCLVTLLLRQRKMGDVGIGPVVWREPRINRLSGWGGRQILAFFNACTMHNVLYSKAEESSDTQFWYSNTSLFKPKNKLHYAWNEISLTQLRVSVVLFLRDNKAYSTFFRFTTRYDWDYLTTFNLKRTIILASYELLILIISSQILTFCLKN